MRKLVDQPKSCLNFPGCAISSHEIIKRSDFSMLCKSGDRQSLRPWRCRLRQSPISSVVRRERRLTERKNKFYIIKRRIYFYTKFNFKFHWLSCVLFGEVRRLGKKENKCGNYFRCFSALKMRHHKFQHHAHIRWTAWWHWRSNRVKSIGRWGESTTWKLWVVECWLLNFQKSSLG